MIRINNVLNAGDVPEYVFEMILFHELLHLEIPPAAEGEGKLSMHPEAFWAAERLRSPCREEGWHWLDANLPLDSLPEFDCCIVLPRRFRLTKEQRLQVLKEHGFLPPKVVRADDPASRKLSMKVWGVMYSGTASLGRV